jgi:hypothetical protein
MSMAWTGFLQRASAKQNNLFPEMVIFCNLGVNLRDSLFPLAPAGRAIP